MQTYYLTIELSYPEYIAPSKARGLHKTRGGHYKTWLGHANDPGESLELAKAKKAGASTRHDQPAEAGDNDDDEEEPIPAGVADDDNLEIDPSLMNQTYEMDADRREHEKQQASRDRQKSKATNDSDKREAEPVLQPIQDIQVLDLHSKRPFISYRGRVFEGEWAEVVGTELILTDHDDKNSNLPALRTLPGDVDLLAASCSRILTTEKALKPKDPEEDPLAEVRKEWLINIPPGVDKSGERAQQASFLEKLIGLKLKKGESDQVTVYAKEAIGKNFKDQRDPTSKPRRKILDPNEELDDDGRPTAKRPRYPRRGRRRRGSDREPVRATPLDERLSVPTPSHWRDLQVAGEGEEDEDMDATSDDIDSLDKNDEEEEDEGTDIDDSDGSQGSGSSQQHDIDDDDEEDEDDDESDNPDSDASHAKGNSRGQGQDVVMRDVG